ncbi:MAG TPA: hypothetical protein VLE49_08495 [Anaerolineales bacterium]|nr:hypothetical protein [Anaerolineales bacterium]
MLSVNIGSPYLLCKAGNEAAWASVDGRILLAKKFSIFSKGKGKRGVVSGRSLPATLHTLICWKVTFSTYIVEQFLKKAKAITSAGDGFLK